MQQNKPEEMFGPDKIQLGYQDEKTIFWSEITALARTLFKKTTGRRVLSETALIEHQHELSMAIHLAQMNYGVVFAPESMFTREEKRFDISLLRDTIILKAELKCITG